MTRRPPRVLIGLSAAIAVLFTIASLPVAGADSSPAPEASPMASPTAAPTPTPVTTVANLPGKRLKMAKAKVVKRWTRFTDPKGDQVARDGTPVTSAPAWSDLTTVSVGRGKAQVKLVNKLDHDHPVGAVDTYYGIDANLRAGQDAFYIVAKTAGKLPTNVTPDVTLIVTFDGESAVPLQVGSVLGPYDGAEWFTLSGPFEGGAWASGTTHLVDWDPSQPIPFYNGPSRDVGFYDRKSGTFNHVARVPKGSTAVTITLRSATADGVVSFDELHLPSGGRFIGLDSPAWGLKVSDKKSKPLACRAVATYSAGAAGAEDLEAGTNRIVYTVGWGDVAKVGDRVAALGPSVPLELTAVGSDQEPEMVDATVEIDDATRTARISLVVPDGQWRFAYTGKDDLKTPSGQFIIDLRPLTGLAGLVTGPGLDGFLAGDPTCGS